MKPAIRQILAVAVFLAVVGGFATWTSSPATGSSADSKLTLTVDAPPCAGSDSTLNYTVVADPALDTRVEGVQVSVTGANGDQTLDPSTADGGHTYQGSYIGHNAGKDTIVATVYPFINVVNINKEPPSNEVDYTWEAGPPKLTLSANSDSSIVDTTVTLTVTATCGISGEIDFDLTGPSSNEIPPANIAPGSSSATTSFSEPSPGTNTIYAFSSKYKVKSDPIDHEWTSHVFAVKMQPPPTSICTQTQATVSARVTRDGSGWAGADVTFTIHRPGSTDQTLTATSGSDGLASATYTESTPGDDSVSATAATIDVVAGTPIAVSVSSEPVTFHWQDCASSVSVTITPANSSTVVNTSLHLTVAVTCAGQISASIPVELKATSPGQPTLTLTADTDANGRAPFDYSRANPETDSLSAKATCGSLAGQGEGVAIWTSSSTGNPPVKSLVISLHPAGVTTTAGSPFTATAEVTDGSQPVAGAVVTFHSDLAGQPTLRSAAGGVRTNAAGLASFTFTRNVMGADRISATATATAYTPASASINHQWAPQDGIVVTLAPAGTASQVGTRFVATATVLDTKHRRLNSVTVRFSARMAGSVVVTASATTDRDGHATFGWIRSGPGVDTVAAAVALSDGRHGQAEMSHFWQKKVISSGGPTTGTSRTTTSSPTTANSGPPGTLRVTDSSPLAGVPDFAVGSGCAPNADVTLRLGSVRLPSTTADGQGQFRVGFGAPDLPTGRHFLTATCGALAMRTAVDYVMTAASTGTGAAALTTTTAVLTFFVLLVVLIARPGAGRGYPGRGRGSWSTSYSPTQRRKGGRFR